MGLGERIRLYRKMANMTQSELAEKLGIKKSTLSGYENGTRKPDVLKLIELSKILGVSGDVLLDTEYQMNPEITKLADKYVTLDLHGKRMVNFVLDEEYTRCIGHNDKSNLDDSGTIAADWEANAT